MGLVLTLASCNQSKIAYVNIDEVLKEYEGSKNAEKLMRQKSEQIMAELEPMAREFQLKVQDFQMNSSKLSSKAKAEKEQLLVQEQQVLQQRQQMAQQQVQQEGQQLYLDIDKKIDSLIGKYAKSNGYSFILGTSASTKSIVYGDETKNITDQVIESMNNSVSSKEENTPELEKADTLIVN